MRNTVLLAFALLAMHSCQNKEKPASDNVVKAIAQDTLAKTIVGTADVADAPAKDAKAVELIKKQLLILLLKDMPVLTKEDRYFYYEAFDLNNDNINEYFVGFSNSYFCGSGGCSGYILNNDGSLINKFMVTDFPIVVTSTFSEKFKDLLFSSKGKFHLMKMKNGKYPSNPSVQEVWKGNVPEKTTRILDINDAKYEKFSF